VRNLIDLHARCTSFVDNQFQKEPLFQGALKKAFETTMNNDVSKKVVNAEYLAAFCDRLLKKGGTCSMFFC